MRHAIIGTGFGLSTHLPAFSAISGIEVIAISNNGGPSLDLPTSGIKIFQNWRKMLDATRPDSVSVVVPPLAQYEIVEFAINRGIHVLCEKPLGIDKFQAHLLLKKADLARIKAAVGLQYRFEYGIATMRNSYISGVIGDFRRINVDWVTSGRADPGKAWSWQNDSEMGGGVINGFLPHVVDMIYWLLGCEILSVLAKSAILIQSRHTKSSNSIAVTAEDSLDAICDIGNEKIAGIRITNCQSGGDGMRIEIHGERGILRYSHPPPFIGNVDLNLCTEGNNTIPLKIVSPKGGGQGDTRVAPMTQLADKFFKVVHGIDVPDMPTFRDGARCQDALTMVKEAIKKL